MFIIFFLCLKLSILHLCVSDLGYRCEREDSLRDPNRIFLIKDTDNYFMNFFQACRDFYKITIVSQTDAIKYNNVIHLGAPGYYDGKPLKNRLVYAGNISNTLKAVCNATNITEPKFDCHEKAKLVSKSVKKINDGDIYDFVQKMEIDENFSYKQRESCRPPPGNTTDLKIVILCLDGTNNYNLEVNIKEPLKLIIAEHSCKDYINKYEYHLLAVLAPKPFEVFSEYTVPTIFYNTPYMFTEYKAAFPNSMNLLSWRLLKYGFLKFIQTIGWQRVVVVSDNSEYSIEFENELTTLFNKERIVYTVVRCEDAACNMDKIIKELIRVTAWIVIANVEEKNAQYLIRAYTLPDHAITWLVRDMTADGRKMNPNHLLVFSISLGTVKKAKSCNADSNILTGLSSIALAYQDLTNKDYRVKRLTFFRRFAAKINQKTKEITEAIVFVNRLKSRNVEKISTMNVNANGAELIDFNDPFVLSGKPADGPNCLAKSYDYFNSCEDKQVLLLMFVILMFTTTLLLITFYFDNSSPYNDIRYQSF